MPAKKKGDEANETTVAAYRYDDARRTNVPPAALAAQGRVREVPRLLQRIAIDQRRGRRKDDPDEAWQYIQIAVDVGVRG